MSLYKKVEHTLAAAETLCECGFCVSRRPDLYKLTLCTRCGVSDGAQTVLEQTMCLLILYGSYRFDRRGIRRAEWITNSFVVGGHDAELIDAKAIGLPMLDRMYKEYPSCSAPAALEGLALKIRNADASVFVTGEYNRGVQPGLKNLMDHFLEE